MARRLAVLLSALAVLAAGPAAAERGAPPAAPAPARPAKAPLSEEAKEARARAWFTDAVLLDQAGRPRRFYTDVVQGRVLCVAFVFTACTDACPLLMAKLQRVRAGLGERFGRDVSFVAVSVDPENDTPAVLEAWARKHGAVGPGWTLLTGGRAEVATVLKRLGELSEDPGDHATAFVAGNARTRHWTKVRPDASPDTVADLLRQLADEPDPAPAAPARAD